MRKNKGFTLIELLAVIVILAIIAVITVPKIAEMIESSRKGSAEDAFFGAIKAAELGHAKALQENHNLAAGTCTMSGAASVTCTNGAVMSVSGSAPEAGIISLDKNGSASVAATKAAELKINGYYCSGNSSSVTCNDTASAS